MKQPQLSDAIFNKKRNVNTVAMWNKLYTKTTYLAAISFLGEKRYKELCLTDTLYRYKRIRYRRYDLFIYEIVGFRKVCPTII